MKSLNGKRFWFLIIGITLVIVVCIATVAYSNNPQRQIQKKLETGARYLEELNYEQAIATYRAVLEIDERCEEAYLGMATAYKEMGDIPKAIEILEEGLELVESDRMEKMLEELRILNNPAPEVELKMDEPEPTEALDDGDSTDESADVEEVIKDYTGIASLEVSGRMITASLVASNGIEDTYIGCLDSNERDWVEYYWIVRFEDDLNTFEIGTTTFKFEDGERTITLNDMQHNIWIFEETSSSNIADTTVSVEGNTITWTAMMPEDVEFHGDKVRIVGYQIYNSATGYREDG